MVYIMLLDLAITLGAAILGAMRWPKANTAWKFVIAGAWVLLFGSISKNLAFHGIIINDGWGVMLGTIPIIKVLYVCGSEFLILLGIWKMKK